MEAALVRTLQANRAQIRARWEELLRATQASTPLANPDLLIHLLDSTLDQVFSVLDNPHHAARRAHVRAAPEGCPCGRNPFHVYFVAGEQALVEALVRTQAGPPLINSAGRGTAITKLYLAVRQIAKIEEDAFCAMCQHRTNVVNMGVVSEVAK